MKLRVSNPNALQAVTNAVLPAARTFARPASRFKAITGSFEAVIRGSRAENAPARHIELQLAAEAVDGRAAVVQAVSFDTSLWACRELLPLHGAPAVPRARACNVSTTGGRKVRGARVDLTELFMGQP